jgi:hypothetical protein
MPQAFPIYCPFFAWLAFASSTPVGNRTRNKVTWLATHDESSRFHFAPHAGARFEVEAKSDTYYIGAQPTLESLRRPPSAFDALSLFLTRVVRPQILVNSRSGNAVKARAINAVRFGLVVYVLVQVARVAFAAITLLLAVHCVFLLLASRYSLGHPKPTLRILPDGIHQERHLHWTSFHRPCDPYPACK